METVTVKLLSPIPNGDKSIESLTFREAEVGDACNMDSVKGEIAQTLAMLSGMCDTPLPVLKRMKMRDLKRVVDAVAPLLGNEDMPLANGSTSPS